MTRKRIHSSSRQTTSTLGRRKFLTGTGVGLAAALAGCGGTGDGGEETTAASGDEGEMTTAGSGDEDSMDESAGDPLARAHEVDISGLTMQWWDIANTNSARARQTVEQFVSDFENETGANININHYSPGQLIGAEILKQFRRGQYPAAIESEATYLGRFYQGGWFLPFDEWKVGLDQEIVDSLQWLTEPYATSTKGFREDAYDFPWGWRILNALHARTDKIDEAGLDPDSDFPPDDWPDMVDKAKTIQENTDVESGYQVFGANFDWMDSSQMWALGEDLEDGRFLNSDWTEVNYKSDAWRTATQHMVDAVQEHGISGGGTPSMSDEQTTQNMLAGKVGMATIEWLQVPVFLEQGPDIYKNNMRYYEMPNADKSPYTFGGYTLGITRPAEGADEQKWTRKQQAGIQLNNMWLQPDFMKDTINNIGFFPSTQNVWEDVEVEGDESHKASETAFSMAEGCGYTFEAHPQTPAIAINIPGRQYTEMLAGNKTVDEGLQDTYDEAQQLV